MTVRPATDADVAMLAALRRAWAEEDAGPVDDPDYEAVFVDWYAGEGDRRLTWIGLVAEQAVGTLSMLEYRRMPKPGRPSSRWGYISNVFVLRQHRDRGLGRQLLDAALAAARERAYVRLVLSPSERAIPFYARAGFVPADELMIRRMD